jgi:hypothetical protein
VHGSNALTAARTAALLQSESVHIHLPLLLTVYGRIVDIRLLSVVRARCFVQAQVRPAPRRQRHRATYDCNLLLEFECNSNVLRVHDAAANRSRCMAYTWVL